MRFKTEVCTCLQFPTEALNWIKEVEMVDSVDDSMSSSVTEIRMPNFELLKYSTKTFRIPASRKRPLWSLFIWFEYLRVTGATDSVENYADLFTFCLRNDDIQEFDSKWDGIFLSMTEYPTWWHLGRIVQIKNTRVWETQDRIGIVWPGDSSEEGWTWSSQIEDSIEQHLRNRNFGARNGNYARTPWSRIRGQNSVYKEFLEIVGNGKPTGSVVEKTIDVLHQEKCGLDCLVFVLCLSLPGSARLA